MNEIALRETALSEVDFYKLDTLAAERLPVKPKFIRVVVSQPDEYGQMVETVDYRESGYEVSPVGEIPARLLESILRPTRPENIAAHLLRLSAHKVFTRGKKSWEIVCADLCRDMAGLSEYAIVKTLERFRQSTASEFFPDPAKILEEAKAVDWALRNFDKKTDEKRTNQPEKPFPRPDAKTRRQVSMLVKIGLKANPTRWEKRWMDAYRARKAKYENNTQCQDRHTQTA